MQRFITSLIKRVICFLKLAITWFPLAVTFLAHLSLSLSTSPPYHPQWPVNGLHFLFLIWEKDWEISCCVILRISEWWPASKYWDSNPSFSIELVSSYRWVFVNLLASFSTFPSYFSDIWCPALKKKNVLKCDMQLLKYKSFFSFFFFFPPECNVEL